MNTATIKHRRRRKAAPASPTADHRAIIAARLDRLADIHLQLGFAGTAERLAWRAAAMREGAR